MTTGGAVAALLMAAPRKRRPPAVKDRDLPAKAKEPTPWRTFDEWWPRVVRVGAVGFAIVHVFLAQFGIGEVDPAVLTFCGLLAAGAGAAGRRSE